MKLRAPAVPLITVDPYFSVWSPSTTLNFVKTMHWTEKSNSIIGTVTVDGEKYLFFGYNRDIHKMKQISIDINALSTTAVYEAAGITLTAVFTTPVLPDDYRLLTRPVSYLSLSYVSNDGKAHEVIADITANEELCLDRALQNSVVTEEANIGGSVRGMRMGNSEQKPLNRDGDDVRIDWGYFYLAANGDKTDCGTRPYRDQTLVYINTVLNEGEKRLVMFAYDDIESIEYFHKHLKSWWNKDGQTIEEAILEASKEYDDVMLRCNAFSEKLYSDACKAGGEKYAELLSLAYRQVMAAHKLVIDENGELLWISKECFSNGCAATVDVSYPSIPMFLLYNPELVKAMMRPVYRYARSTAWTNEYKFDFAPHDVGRYPILNGQLYGYHKDTGEMSYDMQMPVEECGNMLIMDAAVALETGDTSFAEEHLDLSEQWVKYLIENGRDPENQLCTDDFAGHLAHNCNLSVKAIMGIAGLGLIYGMMGDDAKKQEYLAIAKDMAEDWKKRASNGDGSYRLAFDRPNTFSMKYNMIWDKLWKTDLFGQELMNSELKENRKHFNEYGMPLDSRSEHTKSDWYVWVASMLDSKEDFESFIEPLWRTYNDSESRVPMTDWYDTASARKVNFQHRTVQGGLFMKVLADKHKN